MGCRGVKWVGLVGVSVFLSACGSSVPQLETVGMASGSSGQQQGTVFLKASQPGRCPSGQIRLGQKGGDGRYLLVKTVPASGQGFAKTGLSSGEYHIVGFGCRVGERTVSIGYGRSGGFMSGKTFYYKSFASFRVSAGDVLNVGHVQFSAKRGAFRLGRGIDYTVTNLSAVTRKRVKDKYPALYPRMKTRLMVQEQKVLSARLKTLCSFGKKFRKHAKKIPHRLSKLCKKG